MQRNSQQDNDGTVWSTASLQLGARGLDLRRPSDPGVLSEALNARFLDDRTGCRRDGHVGRAIQEQYFNFPSEPFRVTDEWVYGHGTRVTLLSNETDQQQGYPIHIKGRGTFELNGTNVVWTGDRVFAVTQEGPFNGRGYEQSLTDDTVGPFYSNGGIEAFLPVQTDAVHPAPVSGTLVDFTLTDRHRVVVQTTADSDLVARVFDRNNGMLVDETVLDTGVLLTRLRVVRSSQYTMVFYLTDDNVLTTINWSGSTWSVGSVVASNVEDCDTTPTPSGLMLVWRTVGGEIASIIKAGRYVGAGATSTPFVFGSTVDTTTTTPNGGVTVAISPAGHIGLVWGAQDGGHEKVWTMQYTAALEPYTTEPLLLNDTDEHDKYVITACFRGLANAAGAYLFNIIGGRDSTVHEVHHWQVDGNSIANYAVRYNASLASKAFRVGDQVFVWCWSDNSSTNFLLAVKGAALHMCGVADREEAVAAPEGWVPEVVQDPDHTYWHHWIRLRNVGNYIAVGNARTGALNFLPKLSAANYGRSVYLAGSLVRNWDGQRLIDAGCHDFPVVQLLDGFTGSGSLTDGLYQVRVYPVFYNAQGERFQGSAITYSITLSGDTGFTVTIQTMPATNQRDIVYEVYRTPAGGGAFRYEGKIEHTFDSATVDFQCLLSDVAISGNTADPSAPNLDLVELESFGPIGCEVLCASADRLWGIGGQVPPGVVEFSKLYVPNYGAGFNDEINEQVMDIEGGVITSIASFNDATIVAWQHNRLYILVNSGPDNYGVGSFGVPQLQVADGALTHWGTVVTPVGIAYWGSGGPRVLVNTEVEDISQPIAELAQQMTPSGVRIDYSRREVVWYTEEGDALLWNYASGNYAANRPAQSSGSRWARWDGLRIAGCSQSALVTVDGRYLVQTEHENYDDGRHFTFKLATGNVRPEDLLAGNTLLRRFGVVGEYISPHRTRFRLYYDGSPLWFQSKTWEPETGTWLTSVEDLGTLTAAEIDALPTRDRSGSYSTHHRTKKQHCQFFRLEISDMGVGGFIPWEFVFEVGEKPGLARTPINTFENR